MEAIWGPGVGSRLVAGVLNNQLANATNATTAATGQTLTEPLVDEEAGFTEARPVRTGEGRCERTTGVRLTG